MNNDKPTAVQRELFDWWQQSHSTDNASLLTGSKGNDVWEELNVVHRILSGKTILNIGVGLGYCTRELAERKGAIVHALDISEVALERVKDVVACTWRPDQFADFPSDTFDLAISHLVTQHMGNNDVVDQMRAVIKSLKTGGVFAMQFAYSTDPQYVLDDQVGNRKWGSVCRTLSEMSALVSQAGGKIVWIHKDKQFPEWKSGWYGIHIVKDNNESVQQYLVAEHRYAVSRHFIEAGLQMIQLGHSEKAVQNFTTSVEIDSENFEAYFNLGRVYQTLKRNKEASENFLKAFSLNPNDSKTILELGKLYAVEGQIDQSRKLLLNYLKLNPDNNDVWDLLMNDRDKDLSRYLVAESQKAVLSNSQTVRVFVDLLTAVGEVRAAHKICLRYLENNSDHRTIQNLLQQLELLLQEREEKSYLLLNAGEDFLINQQDEVSAMEAFLKAIELNPECDPAYNDLGIIYLNQQKYGEAIDVFQKALDLDPENELYIDNFQQVDAIVKDHSRASIGESPVFEPEKSVLIS